ncbi:MAG: gliding motility lipoprotein GldD [Polaribacter sp.]|nr:gliding motility lipoprotein GldD [Polaribacter sp.]
MRNLYLFFFSLLFISCEQEIIPKPKAYLSLEYPKKAYQKLPIPRPYTFDVLKGSVLKDEQKNWLKITYPALKASIDITYREVDDNLLELLKEAEKLVFKHTLKAEEITSKDFLNTKKKVFGSMYEITGNAASQIQFHATDSSKNFIKGSLYFYTKPNYDSILPAVTYIKKDILRLMETLKWQ